MFANSKEVQAPYAPIFDGRLLLGMSLFSKKYSISLLDFYAIDKKQFFQIYKMLLSGVGHYIWTEFHQNLCWRQVLHIHLWRTRRITAHLLFTSTSLVRRTDSDTYNTLESVMDKM